MNKSIKRILIIGVFLLGFYFTIGFVVIQPIGAIPDGATIMYWRLGLNIPFITSPDGFLLDNDQKVSLLGRGMAMGALAEVVKDRKIMTFSYSESMYLISTGGVEFEK